MKELKSDVVDLYGVKFKAYERRIVHGDAQLYLKAGTNGLSRKKGYRHCPRAILTMDIDSGMLHVEPVYDIDGDVIRYQIVCCGSGELLTLLEALEFWQETLLEQCAESLGKTKSEETRT